MDYTPASAKVIFSDVALTPSTVAVTVNSPASSEVSFTVEPPAEPVEVDSELSTPPDVAQEIAAPETGASSLVTLTEKVTESVPSAVTEVLSADRLTLRTGLQVRRQIA